MSSLGEGPAETPPEELRVSPKTIICIDRPGLGRLPLIRSRLQGGAIAQKKGRLGATYKRRRS